MHPCLVQFESSDDGSEEGIQIIFAIGEAEDGAGQRATIDAGAAGGGRFGTSNIYCLENA